jgi:hypothetical protein
MTMINGCVQVSIESEIYCIPELLYLMRWKSLETLKNVNFHKFVTLNLRPENILWKNINLTIRQLQVFSDSISTSSPGMVFRSNSTLSKYFIKIVLVTSLKEFDVVAFESSLDRKSYLRYMFRLLIK